MASYTTEYLKININSLDTSIFKMKVKDILAIYYVAERGKSEEDGAVQRLLSSARINSIKEFILSGNMFFNTFILNWCAETPITYKNSLITIPIEASAAQVIDGQHRLEGLKRAVETKPSINNDEVLVLMCERLKTEEAAKIFININSEQKPVPKSLIYDLFGLINDDKALPINRAKDITDYLNEAESSPYKNMIKYPGPIKRSGMQIDLSTFINTLKTYLTKGNMFETYKLTELETQKTILLNYFTAIKNAYEKEGKWLNASHNPFLKGLGFSGAIDHLMTTLMPKCVEKKSFSVKTFESLLNLENNILDFQEIKSMDGKTARKRVKEHLDSLVNKHISGDEFEF